MSSLPLRSSGSCYPSDPMSNRIEQSPSPPPPPPPPPPSPEPEVMAFLFNRNKQPRAAVDLCRSTNELLQRLPRDPDVKPNLRLEEELARNLAQMKFILQGSADSEVIPQQVYQLVHLLMSEDVLLPLAGTIHKLPFESRKDAQAIFCHVFRYKPAPELTQTQNPDPPIVHYVVSKKPDLIPILCNGYNYRECAVVCGQILREALKHDTVAALILYHEPQTSSTARTGLQGVDPNIPASGNGVFWNFFDWVDKSLFEISADAFNTFRDLLTKHKRLSAHFLMTNYDRFVPLFHEKFVQSGSYVTKRQSLQLLSSLLLERTNYNFMQRYVESAEHLKIAMRLLKDDRRMINYEGFHVFKVFVANPQKSVAVQTILIKNRDKMLAFLPNFLPDRKEDAQFDDEKAYLIRMIEQLPSSPIAPTQQSQPFSQSSQQPSGGAQQSQQQQRGHVMA